LHYQTKKTLPLFFVDLEPSPSNKDIFAIDTLYYTKIKIEEPCPRRNLIQCTRCQSYGHTQAYCNHQPKCVKCGDNHLSSECKKDKDSPASCAFCTQPHPANYRGCQVHKDLQKFNQNSTPKSTLRDQNSKQNFFSTLSKLKWIDQSYNLKIRLLSRQCDNVIGFLLKFSSKATYEYFKIAICLHIVK